MSTRATLLAIAAVPALLACGEATAPLPSSARRFEPPAVYARWWRTVERCSGLTGDLAAVQWYMVPGAADRERGGVFTATYQPRGHRVLVADSFHLSGDMVRTVMLHALRRAVDRPRALFLGRCAGVVLCDERCVREAGPAPAPPPGAVRVAPRALEVAVRAEATDTGALDTGDFLEVIVTARNPATTPVIVDLAPSGDAGPPGSFGFIFEGSERFLWFDERVRDPSEAQFAPGEVKTRIFDFRVGPEDGRRALPPDTYRVGGRFNAVEATASAPLVVGR